MDEPGIDSLRAQCAAALDELAGYAGTGAEPVDEVPRAPGDAAEPPSLYAWFEELLALRNEIRRGNRKVAETFSRFGDVLEDMREDSARFRERLAAPSGGNGNAGGGSGAVSRGLALALIDVCDRIDRLRTAAASRAEDGWLARLKAEGRWRRQAEAIAFLREHFQPVLAAAGLQRIHVLGKPFDPLWMKAVGAPAAAGRADPAGPDSPPGGPATLVVRKELLPGYRMGDQCLRPAEVRVTAKTS